MSEITKDQVIDWLSEQSVLEIADIVKTLEEKWGVSAAAPVAVAAAARSRPENRQGRCRSRRRKRRIRRGSDRSWRQ